MSCSPTIGGSPGGGAQPAAGFCWPAVVDVDASGDLAVDTYHLVTPPAAPLPVVLTFPAPALSVGCRIGVQYVSATPARKVTFAGAVSFDVEELSLFIPGEALEFISDGVVWRVSSDSRIPHVVVLAKSAETSWVANVTHNVDPNIVQVDNGAIAIGPAPFQIVPQRKGVYRTWSTVGITTLTIGFQAWIDIGPNGAAAQGHTAYGWNSAAVATVQNTTLHAETTHTWDPANGWNVRWTLRHNQVGVSIVTPGTGPTSPKLGIVELLSGTVGR